MSSQAINYNRNDMNTKKVQKYMHRKIVKFFKVNSTLRKHFLSIQLF